MRHLIQHLSLTPTTESGFVKITNYDIENPFSFSNLHYELNGFTNVSDMQVGIRVAQTSFANVFPTIKKNVNELTISVNGYVYNVILPQGYYTNVSICDEIVGQVTNYFGNEHFSDFLFGCEINERNASFIVMCNYNFTILYNRRTPFNVLGLASDVAAYPMVASKPTDMYIITSPKMCNMLGATNIIISTNVFRTLNMDISNGYGFLANIQVTANPFSMIHYQNQSDAYFMFPEKQSIDEIDLQFRDQDGDFLDFQGIPWNMVLEFKFTALPNPRESILDFIKNTYSKEDKEDDKKEQLQFEIPSASDIPHDESKSDTTDKEEDLNTEENTFVMQSAYQNVYPQEL